jgi:hypothetical protein
VDIESNNLGEDGQLFRFPQLPYRDKQQDTGAKTQVSMHAMGHLTRNSGSYSRVINADVYGLSVQLVVFMRDQ